MEQDIIEAISTEGMGYVGKQVFDSVVVPILTFLINILYQMVKGCLSIVGMMEDAFNIFAGTVKIEYKGMSEYLIDVILGSGGITVAFWAMTAVAVVLTFVFTIIAVTRKTLDIEEHVKQSIGQIITTALKTGLNMFLLSVLCFGAIKLVSITLVQVDSMLARSLAVAGESSRAETIADQEYEIMGRIYQAFSRYQMGEGTNGVSDSPDYNYVNANACFNEIRVDLMALKAFDFYNADYDPPKGKMQDTNWQSRISAVAFSSDISKPLEEGVKKQSVCDAMSLAFKSARHKVLPLDKLEYTSIGGARIDRLIFVTATMNASKDVPPFDISFNDPVRKGYMTGSKDYCNYNQVSSDFNMFVTKFDYFTPVLLSIVFVIILGMSLLIFIARLFELVFLYVMGPLFCSVSPLDDGEKFKGWRQAFVTKLFTGFGAMYMMRVYLMIVPVIMSNDLILFSNGGVNWLAKVVFIMGGAYAVLKGGSLLTGIIANTVGNATNSESALSGFVAGGALGMAQGGAGKAMGAGKFVAGKALKFGAMGVGGAVVGALTGAGKAGKAGKELLGKGKGKGGTPTSKREQGKGGDDKAKDSKASSSGAKGGGESGASGASGTSGTPTSKREQGKDSKASSAPASPAPSAAPASSAPSAAPASKREQGADLGNGK